MGKGLNDINICLANS